LLGDLAYMHRVGPRAVEEQLKVHLENKSGRTTTLTLPFVRVLRTDTPAAVEYVQRTAFDSYVKGNLIVRSRASLLIAAYAQYGTGEAF
jgi:hypothetical protein